MTADYSHGDRRVNTRRRVRLMLFITTLYMVAEIVGGWYAHSLALLADAGHMFSDIASLALTLFAMWFAQKPATSRHTYGFHRTEIFAALVNSTSLLVIAVFILMEAWERFQTPHAVLGVTVMAVAAGGLIINLVGLNLLGEDAHDNHNVRGVWLHVLADALGSVAALLAGLAAWARGWTWVDPAASMFISLLIIHSSWSLLKETVFVLMESAPPHIDVEQVRTAMAGIQGIQAVHDLHIWTITSGRVSLSAHVLVHQPAEQQNIRHQLAELLEHRFEIRHTTLQIETDVGCAQGEDCMMGL
ncbi:MAG TPA: cation diffusion facilitator family transporter [Gammaproteobacteria bacterium]|nr:cation diffusion facilitator family transporter [Gammaproteobacteria bacterium]